MEDRVVFRRLFAEYYSSLCLFAHKYVADKESAADIVQEVFVSLWSRRKDFNTQLQVKSFLYTCVRNKALNEIAHMKVVSENGEKMKLLYSDSCFHDYVVETETIRLMHSEIDKLPQQMSTVMKLSMDGMKNAQIAEQMNVSINTVRTLKRLAYKKLRAGLGNDFLIFILFFINI